MVERSPRVKAMDFHPELSWVMLGLYSGTIALHDYSTNVQLLLLRHVLEHSNALFIQLELFVLYLLNNGWLQDLMI